jgi:hypothetical protein
MTRTSVIIYVTEVTTMTSPIADFTYTTSPDGYTAIIPNTPDAVSTYNTIYKDGVYRLDSRELKAFQDQARRAGYTVRKVRLGKPLSASDVDALLAELA